MMYPWKSRELMGGSASTEIGGVRVFKVPVGWSEGMGSSKFVLEI